MRTPLEPILLQIKAYGLGDPRFFDLIERPPDNSIDAALLRLMDLGAFTDSSGVHGGLLLSKSRKKDAVQDAEDDDAAIRGSLRITAMGKVLSVLPMDVVLGKMLILGSVCCFIGYA
jgi:HrpA-like RNA helicase